MAETGMRAPSALGRRQAVDQRAPPAWRAAAVTLGPSLAFDLVLGGSVLATAVGGFAPAGRSGRARMGRALAAGGALAAWAYVLAVRPWLVRWGATDDEVRRSLPGDALVPCPLYVYTRALTIEAPAEAIWPWLVQMGQGRGGLYSYDWLENLAGLEIHSADRIIPELQLLAVGDVLPLSPGGSELRVAAIEPGRALVLRAVADVRPPCACCGVGASPVLQMSWAFVLDPIDHQTTRLLVRWRGDSRPRAFLAVLEPLFVEVPHFVMERKQMLGIKHRAERRWAAQGRAQG